MIVIIAREGRVVEARIQQQVEGLHPRMEEERSRLQARLAKSQVPETTRLPALEAILQLEGNS